jgi:nucleoside-diphosphate-sugar epimerase
VSGAREGRFGEHELDLGAPFRNTYERSKAEAEALVAASGHPAAIARPSIVVGEAGSGWTAAFNVLYWPLRAYARGLLDTFPADPRGVVDAISVDAVVAGLLGLHDDPGARGVFALAAGPAAVTIGDLGCAAAAALGRPSPRFAEVDIVQAAGQAASVYLPYFGVRTRFGVTNGHALMRRAGGIVRPLTELLDGLLAYAAAARWGKRAVPRSQARALRAAALTLG